MRKHRGHLLSAVVCSLFLVPSAHPMANAGHAPDVPELVSPPEGLRGYALWDSYYDLEPFGYTDEEFFVSGIADSGSGTAPYTTRIIVTRPVDPTLFNGVVLLDWVNVTAQFENAVDTMLAREMLMREGFAYVHVSAQAAGLCCLPVLTPQMWDPVRYANLDHPGDAYSFDIFTQVARAFRDPGPGLDPMGELGIGAVQHVLAAGQSQSGIRLHDYLTDWLPSHPDAVGSIDAVLVHGDVGKPKFTGHGLPVPVIHLLGDFEAVDDGVGPGDMDPNVRLWEVAGTAHADLFIGYQSEFGHGPRVLAGAPRVGESRFREIIDAAGQYGEVIDPLLAVCIAAGAAMPMRYATSTAIYELANWLGGGEPPSHGPRYEFVGGSLATDEHGNALGGIRLPPIDVPVARYESTACQLGGITVPFLDHELHSLYPTHAEYYAMMASRSDEAVGAGWLLPEDAVDLMRRACRALARWPDGQDDCAPYEPPPFRALADTDPEPLPAPDPEPAPASAEEPLPVALPATGGDASLVWVSGAFLVLLVLRGLTALERRDDTR
jgi:hypothetical protein